MYSSPDLGLPGSVIKVFASCLFLGHLRSEEAETGSHVYQGRQSCVHELDEAAQEEHVDRCTAPWKIRPCKFPSHKEDAAFVYMHVSNQEA